MIIKEHYMTRSDGVELEITFSDHGYTVMRDDVEYDEAVDPTELHREYEEGSELIFEPSAAVNYWVREIQNESKTLENVPEQLIERVEEAMKDEPDGEAEE